MTKETIYAPIKGIIVQIENVKDEVFSQKMLGDGLAILPSLEKQTLVSPIEGTIVTVFPTKHAITILTKSANELMIHIGIDTVNMKGEGFNVFVKDGDLVQKGDKIVEVDFALIKKHNYATDVILLLTNLDDRELTKASGEIIALEELFSVVE